ncbi:MAG: sigma-70 family RNA polymerase sigma factor [Spirochaetes bacterium]|nr:MAG: sigma-70 family RNA polymerase sigma factor [Spirochaetota bacterium]
MTESDLHAGFEREIAGAREKLIRMAESILKDRLDAEDVVQETLVAVWQAYGEGMVRDLQAYAARAVWLNALKQRARRRRFVSLEPEALRAQGIPEPSYSPDEDLVISSWELEKAILGLPSHQQAVVRLKYYGGLTFREIGRAMHISMNTAASRCRYALIALRIALRIEK